jgi:hypothetical protein
MARKRKVLTAENVGSVVELVGRLVTLPSSDEEFAAAVRAVAAQHEACGAGAIEQIERELRRQYPAAEVRVRNSLASLGGEPAWYVYRDGAHRDGA